MERIQLIFLGHYVHLERSIHILKQYLPHRVYFIRDKKTVFLNNNDKITDIDVRDYAQRQLEKVLPKWVADKSEVIVTDFMDFDDVLIKLTSVMAKEKKNNNEVLISLQGATIIPSIAATMAAALTSSKAVWLAPSKVSVISEGEKFLTVPIGTGEIIEVKIPLIPDLPPKPCREIVSFINKKGGVVKNKLKVLAEEIGLNNLGANVTKVTSGVVKLSKFINTLRKNDLVETRKIGRKQFEIKLTKKGILTAKILEATNS